MLECISLPQWPKERFELGRNHGDHGTGSRYPGVVIINHCKELAMHHDESVRRMPHHHRGGFHAVAAHGPPGPTATATATGRLHIYLRKFHVAAGGAPLGLRQKDAVVAVQPKKQSFRVSFSPFVESSARHAAPRVRLCMHHSSR